MSAKLALFWSLLQSWDNSNGFPMYLRFKVRYEKIVIEIYIQLTKAIIIMQGGLSMAYIITFTLCPLKVANQWKIRQCGAMWG